MTAGTLCHFVTLGGDKIAAEVLSAIPARNETISFGDDAALWVVAGVHHVIGGNQVEITLYLAPLRSAKGETH